MLLQSHGLSPDDNALSQQAATEQSSARWPWSCHLYRWVSPPPRGMDVTAVTEINHQTAAHRYQHCTNFLLWCTKLGVWVSVLGLLLFFLHNSLSCHFYNHNIWGNLENDHQQRQGSDFVHKTDPLGSTSCRICSPVPQPPSPQTVTWRISTWWLYDCWRATYLPYLEKYSDLLMLRRALLPLSAHTAPTVLPRSRTRLVIVPVICSKGAIFHHRLNTSVLLTWSNCSLQLLYSVKRETSESRLGVLFAVITRWFPCS